MKIAPNAKYAVGFLLAAGIFEGFESSGLHADVHVESADIGIPGVSKMYEATLTNDGSLPATVEQCREHNEEGFETNAAYNIERRDRQGRAWRPVFQFAQPKSCAGTSWTLLWPGQRISTGEEATAARSAFRKGDTVRFVVATRVSVQHRKSELHPTAGFTLDEENTDRDINYRVKHREVLMQVSY